MVSPMSLPFRNRIGSWTDSCALLARVVVILSIVQPGLAPLNAQSAIRWPFDPGDVVYPIGNSYGEYQNPEGRPYHHNGIDILAGAPREVYAVEDGTVTYVNTQSEYFSCVMIGEPVDGGEGYVYCHLEGSSIAVTIEESVQKGAYLGKIVAWPEPNFDHLHLSRVRGFGGKRWSRAFPIDNPILYLSPNADTSDPSFELATGTDLLLFCENETATCQPPLSLRGRLDIVALAHDTIAGNLHVAPYKIDVIVRRSEDNQEVYRSIVVLDGELGSDPFAVHTLYKDDASARSEGSYTERKFYIIATNMDGSRVLTQSDRDRAWNTLESRSGPHEVIVTVWDHGGNSVSSSMIVQVANE